MRAPNSLEEARYFSAVIREVKGRGDTPHAWLEKRREHATKCWAAMLDLWKTPCAISTASSFVLPLSFRGTMDPRARPGLFPAPIVRFKSAIDEESDGAPVGSGA